MTNIILILFACVLFNFCAAEETEKAGYCPLVKATDGGIGLCAKLCFSDSACEGEKKCCSNNCGGSACIAPLATKPTDDTKQGLCPFLTSDSVGICMSECEHDTDCEGTKRCCSNGCGTTCSDTVTTCSASSCPPSPAVIARICSDGGTTGPFCVKDGNTCTWKFRNCTTADDAHFTRPGACPAVSDDFEISTCDVECQYDSDCEGKQKCCSKACGFGQCVDPVPLCEATGYAGTICNDPSISVTVAGDDMVEEDCYRCTNVAICSRKNSTSECGWSGAYTNCMETCKTSAPPPSTCVSRTACGCLLDSSCGWCQMTLSTRDVDVYQFGVCLPSSLSVKCTGDVRSGNYGGSFVSTFPQSCSESSEGSDHVDPNIGDASGIISNERLRNIVKSINEGSIKEEALQVLLATKINGRCNVFVKKILQSPTDGQQATIYTQIELDCASPTQDDEDKACKAINDAYAKTLDIDENELTYCKLEATTTTTSQKKRQTSSSSYIHSSVVTDPQTGNTPTAPNSANTNSFSLWVLAFNLFVVSLIVITI